jgi:hypothetical protein
MDDATIILPEACVFIAISLIAPDNIGWDSSDGQSTSARFLGVTSLDLDASE